MPALATNETVRVEIGSEWYDLRRYLGWYAQRAIEDRSIQPWRDGKIEIRGADRNLARLNARLVAWSLPEELAEANVKRLVPAHATILLARIGDLELEEKNLGVLGDEAKNSPGA